MTTEGAPGSELVEFRVFVDKERATEFAEYLGKLTQEYGGTVASHEPEIVKFRKYMTTEIYEEYPAKTASVITRSDLVRFAATQRVDTPVASRTFNLICAELTQCHHLKNIKRQDYLVRGPLLEQPAEGKVGRPFEENGLRVETLADLVTQLNSTERISGYGQRSRYLMSRLVDALFNLDEPDVG